MVAETCKRDAALKAAHQPPTVVDIGCGQGYLARMLTYMHGLDVVGVEAAQTNTDTAAEKASRLQYEVEKKAKALGQQELQSVPANALSAATNSDRLKYIETCRETMAGEVGEVGELRFLNRLICSERDIGAVVDEVAAGVSLWCSVSACDSLSVCVSSSVCVFLSVCISVCVVCVSLSVFL